MPEHYFTEIPSSKIDIFTINPFIRNRLYQFKTVSGVFSHKKLDTGTSILIKHVSIPEHATTALDMGCGYGVIGIVIAAENSPLTVTMIDINRRAVWIARENAKLNTISNVKILWGNFYAPIKNQTFDVILINPPLALGQKLLEQFIQETPKHLSLNGMFYLVARTKQGAKKISTIMDTCFGNVELLKIQSGYRLFRSQKQVEKN